MLERVRTAVWRDPARRIVSCIAFATFAMHLAFASRYGWFREPSSVHLQ